MTQLSTLKPKAIKKEILRQIFAVIERGEKPTQDLIRNSAHGTMESIEKRTRVTLSRELKEEIVESVCTDILGLGPLQSLIDDEEITEIMVNGPYTVYVERRGRKALSRVKFEDNTHLRFIIEKMMAPTGRRLDESFPYADFALSPGTRVNAVIPPLVVGGPVVTIRKLSPRIREVTDLVGMGSLDSRMADFLVVCIRAKANILFSGATGSGKTTALSVLSSRIHPEERIVVIEDTLEIDIRQAHVIRLLTRPPNIEGKGEITLRELFQNALRMRPSRIVLGEIRGQEAMDYLQALTSGHTGCMAVIHAANPPDALRRLETMALYAGLQLPAWAIRQQIASGLDLVVQHEQLEDGTRKITYLTEVCGLEGDRITLRDLFVYDVEGRDDRQRFYGRFRAVGEPTFLDRFAKRGITFPADWFS